MALVPVKTPLLVKKMFSNYVWDIPTTEKVMYLTFDDGPTPDITDWTLDVLKQYNAKATFFCIGNNVEKYPDIFQNIINDGHAVGNHTHNHLKGWKTNLQDYLKNVSEAQKAIEFQISNSKNCHTESFAFAQDKLRRSTKILNRQSSTLNLFRPPYGQIMFKQAKALKALGYNIIMWDILSFDWDKTVTKKTCAKSVIDNAKAGSIIVFHDSKKAAKNMQYALPRVLKHFSKQGFVFKSL